MATSGDLELSETPESGETDLNVASTSETNISKLSLSTPIMATPKRGCQEAIADEDTTASTISSSSGGTSSDSSNISTLQSRASSGGCQTTAAGGTPRYNMPRFPVRIGITWRKGEKLEAMDFSRTWYPSKIVEIDEAQKCVLIHFEGWNQRYDEWVPMDSEKLRPVTRHSERKDKGSKKRRVHPHPVSDLPSIYRAGDQVMAKWTDCKKYPAKINRLMEDGMYEVIFYDGVSRLIQAMNIQPMPEEMKNMKLLSMKVPPAPRPKIPFKHIKVSLPESIRRKQEQNRDKHKLSNVGRLMAKKMKRHSPQKPPGSSSGNLTSGTAENPPGTDAGGGGKAKVSPLKVKKFKKSSVECEALVSTLSEADCMKLFGTTPNATATSADVTSHPSTSAAVEPTAGAEASTSKVVEEGSLPVAGPDGSLTNPAKKTVMMKDMDTVGSSETQVITSVVGQPVDTAVATQTQTQTVGVRVRPKMLGSRRSKKRASTDLYNQPKRKRSKSIADTSKVIGMTKKRPPALGTGEKAKSLDAGSGLAPPPAGLPLVPPVFIPSKAFIVEEDHNPYKCPHEGCNKDFRKENLLAYHIKYYHTEAETPTSSSAGTSELASVTSPLLPPSSIHSPGGTPGSRKRRKKTNSVCSTDSDVSISSKGKSSNKRQRHDSEISITTASPDVSGRDLWADVKHRVLQDSAAEETVAADTEDDDVDADVVNCICGQRETSGLMIQCEICMCWQHFACVDTKNSGVPPANYICLLCENTPGIRDSCRHMCDMGWERRGELPSFPFVSESCSQHLKSIASECNELASSLHGIKAALHSTRRQIKISKEEDDPEFQLWQTDWDNWTKPEEDLTLTPRSVDPDPSPTPSTFLFPSTPHPSATATTVSSTARTVLSPSASLSSIHSSSSSSSLPVVTTMSGSITSAPQSSLSSQQTSHPPICTTTTTIEVSLMPESPSLMSQPGAATTEESTTPSNITPPSGSSHMAFHSPPISGITTHLPPQTPSVERGGSLPSIQGHAGTLVKDLFPGPSGDAASSSTISLFSDSDGKGIKINGNNDEAKSEEPPFPSSETTVEKSNSGESLSEQRLRQGETPPTSDTQSTLSSASSQSQNTQGTEFQQGINTQLSESTSAATTTVTCSKQGGHEQTPHKDISTLDMVISSTNPASSSDSVDNNCSSVADSKNAAVSVQEGQNKGVNIGSKHLTSLYVDVNGGQGHDGGYNDDDQDNDTDTAEESADPYKNCEHNLLVHVTKVHSDIEKQLELLEQQITELENSEHTNPTVQLSEDNILNDLPALKKSLGKLSRNLVKVQRLCVHH